MNTSDQARIDRLREQALDANISYNIPYFHFFTYFRDHPQEEKYARYANAFAYALQNTEPCINGADELIVGKPAHAITDPAQQAAWEALIPFAEQIAVHTGQDSHMAIDYELLLECGISGVIARIDGYLAQEPSAEKQAFYRCCLACLQAVCAFSEKYAAKAALLAENCSDEARRGELQRIAAICARVPKEPAQSYYEAVQSVNFLTYCISFVPYRFRYIEQFQLGHPDRYLYPFYAKDIAAGRLTDEEAQLLLDCLAIQINNRVCHGLSSGYMIGGRDRDGKLVANPLTKMGMQVIADIRLVYPSVGFCHTHGMPDEYLQKACEILSTGRSHPAIFNDDIITEGLRSYGVNERDSHEYIHSTCVEITPVAASDIWVASPYTNMPQLLLDLLDRDYPDFEALLQAYFDRLDAHIRTNFENEVAGRRLRYERSMNPLLSCFVNDCLAEGTDIEQEGARYNWIMPSFVGVANLVDSLYAVKTAVFDEKWLTMAELRKLLAEDFVGNEPMRRRLLSAIPKYGNDCPDVDAYFARITEHLVAQCKTHHADIKNFRLVPSVFCWIMHEHFGSETGATPDGRCAGFPLGDGSGPCQGRELNGPTASILSSTGWSHKELIGGVAVNMKFSKKTFTAESCSKMKALIRTFLQRGGFEMQINVVNRETLLAAQKDPESYRDLVVRIGGYSDYFVTLSPQMQAEVLLRTEHEV